MLTGRARTTPLKRSPSAVKVMCRPPSARGRVRRLAACCASTERQVLDHSLLDHLEGTWRAQGAPIASALRPGAAPELLDGAFADFGLQVPEEVRTWWSWHDGAEQTDNPWSIVMLGSRWRFFSMEAARAEIVGRRAMAAEATPQNPQERWRWEWIPLSTNTHGGTVVVDGTRDLHGLTTMYYNEPQMGAETMPRPAPSMGTLIQWWIDALNTGAGWNAAEGRWDYDDVALDQDVLRTFLL